MTWADDSSLAHRNEASSNAAVIESRTVKALARAGGATTPKQDRKRKREIAVNIHR
jgi:hypothetical protein